MTGKMIDEFVKLSFLGFIIVDDTAIRLDHISAVHADGENQIDITLTSGQLIKLNYRNSMSFLDQVRQIVAAVQLAQARAQSNILV